MAIARFGPPFNGVTVRPGDARQMTFTVTSSHCAVPISAGALQSVPRLAKPTPLDRAASESRVSKSDATRGRAAARCRQVAMLPRRLCGHRRCERRRPPTPSPIFSARPTIRSSPWGAGDHAPRFAPKHMIAGNYHMFNFMTGRTSTPPSTSKIGQPLESSTAWSRSRASINV